MSTEATPVAQSAGNLETPLNAHSGLDDIRHQGILTETLHTSQDDLSLDTEADSR